MASRFIFAQGAMGLVTSLLFLLQGRSEAGTDSSLKSPEFQVSQPPPTKDGRRQLRNS